MKLEQIIEKKLGKFPVGAWVPYYKEQFSPAWLEKIKACGINFIPTKTPSPAELDAVAAAGLKSLVNDDRVTYASVKDMTKIKDWLAEYRDREDVFGLFVWDEPSPLMTKICGAINGEVQRVAPNLFGYINLHPTYSDRETQRGRADSRGIPRAFRALRVAQGDQLRSLPLSGKQDHGRLFL